MRRMAESREPWPDLFINGAQRSVRDDVLTWLSSLRSVGPGTLITVVTGYLSVRGLLTATSVLRDAVRSGAHVRILLGVGPSEQVRIVAPAVDPRAERETLRRLLHRGRTAITAEVDAIPQSRPDSLALYGLAQLLRHPHVACRRYECGFLHGKAIAAEPESGPARALIGSANFTLAGWTGNQELFSEVDRQRACQVASLADTWWNESTPFDLAAILERRFRAWPHPLVFLQMLRSLYGDEVDTDSALRLHDWEKDGVAKALNIIERHGGVLIADDVGLGKTYEAGEIIRHGRDAGWGPALIICPAHLCRMWTAKLTEWKLAAEVLSYHRMNNLVAEFRESGNWPQHGIIICDEAHWLRNPKTGFAANLHQLLDHQLSPAWRVLLTATPVSNHGRDLYELLTITDPHLEPAWIPSGTLTQRRRRSRTPRAHTLLHRCEQADLLDSKDREELWAELDHRLVRRTREFLRAHYPSVPAFPQQHPVPVDYHLSPQAQQTTAAVLAAVGANTESLPPAARNQLNSLVRDSAESAPLTLAAYELSAYARGTSGMPYAALTALLRLQLLKRLESSPAALAGTTTRMAQRTAQALQDLNRGVLRVPDQRESEHNARRLRETLFDTDIDTSEQRDVDELIDAIVDTPATGTSIPISAQDYNVDRLRSDLEHDHDVLQRLSRLAWNTIPHDRKREALRNLLVTTANHPQGPKILIMAGSRATTSDLGSWLDKQIENDDRLATYRGRLANLGGPHAEERGEVQHVVAEFAPRNAGASLPPLEAARLLDRYDILIGTDILAEGLNLQQAALLVHYDLPWNPQIMGQRAGRIDRVGSLHEDVHCYTIMPDTGLDLILNLLDRLRTKARVAAATVGVPTQLFPDSPTAARDFATIFTRSQRAGTSAPYFADLYRAWLGQALREPRIRQALDELPPAAAALSPTTSGFTYCFASLPGEESTMVRHINTTDRPGHTLFITRSCLREAAADLPKWIRSIHNGDDPVPEELPLLPDSAIRQHWQHRDQIAAAHRDGTSDNHGLELHAWIAPTSTQ